MFGFAKPITPAPDTKTGRTQEDAIPFNHSQHVGVLTAPVSPATAQPSTPVHSGTRLTDIMPPLVDLTQARSRSAKRSQRSSAPTSTPESANTALTGSVTGTKLKTAALQGAGDRDIIPLPRRAQDPISRAPSSSGMGLSLSANIIAPTTSSGPGESSALMYLLLNLTRQASDRANEDQAKRIKIVEADLCDLIAQTKDDIATLDSMRTRLVAKDRVLQICLARMSGADDNESV